MSDVWDSIDPRTASWVATVLASDRVVHAERLHGGYTNDNTLLVTEHGARYVLRRYRLRNSCPIEAGLVNRVRGVVPIAEIVAADPHGDHAGEPVLLSRAAPGHLVNTLLPTLDDRDAAELGAAVGTVLCAIGSVTFSGPGLLDEDLRPSGRSPAAGLSAFLDRCLTNGNGGPYLAPEERDALRALAGRTEPLLEGVLGARNLVHSDFNPRNILAERRHGAWTVTAVLDWEFAMSSTPLFDVGNILRYRRRPDDPFFTGLLMAFRAGTPDLPENWLQISEALDLFGLADTLNRPPDHPRFGVAISLLRQRLG